MKYLKITLCCTISILAAASISACNKKGPVDMSVLVPIVESKSGKDTMDIVHKTHEQKNIDCYKCHHKWENPDRIRNCSNCHEKDSVQITKDTCLKCHSTDN